MNEYKPAGNAWRKPRAEKTNKAGNPEAVAVAGKGALGNSRMAARPPAALWVGCGSWDVV